jgi:tetratricopeptide (TPR) repeat protein
MSAALVVAACTQKPAGPVERPVTLPDLSRVEPSVRNQGQELFDALQVMRNKPGVPAADKGEAYGKLAMLLHAGEYYEAAEPAYLNAQDLTPSDARWPYLLGHLHKSRGEPEKALADFNRALQLKPDDVPTLIWLGRLYLDHGEPARAQPLFEKAQSLRPDVVAGIVGLGQAALAQKDYPRAVDVLEQALRVHPTASSVHSPLAMAYRGLGDMAKAEAHLTEW